MVSKLSNVLKQFGTYDETFKDLPDPGGFFREPKMISTLFYRWQIARNNLNEFNDVN